MYCPLLKETMEYETEREHPECPKLIVTVKVVKESFQPCRIDSCAWYNKSNRRCSVTG